MSIPEDPKNKLNIAQSKRDYLRALVARRNRRTSRPKRSAYELVSWADLEMFLGGDTVKRIKND